MDSGNNINGNNISMCIEHVYVGAALLRSIMVTYKRASSQAIASVHCSGSLSASATVAASGSVGGHWHLVPTGSFQAPIPPRQHRECQCGRAW
jgi:hypothetical protein